MEKINWKLLHIKHITDNGLPVSDYCIWGNAKTKNLKITNGNYGQWTGNDDIVRPSTSMYDQYPYLIDTLRRAGRNKLIEKWLKIHGFKK